MRFSFDLSEEISSQGFTTLFTNLSKIITRNDVDIDRLRLVIITGKVNSLKRDSHGK